MTTGLILMSSNDEDRRFIDSVKNLSKQQQIEVLRSLLQQLEPEVVKEAAEDAVLQVNLGSNNTNGSTVTYSDVVINLYFGNSTDDLDALSNLLDAAAFRLRNGSKVVQPD